MTDTETTKENCPRCGGLRRAFIRAKHKVEGYEEIDEMSLIDWWDKGEILECGGCETVYFRHTSYFSEWEGLTVKVFPFVPKRTRPAWSEFPEMSDGTLDHILSELYRAHNSDLPVLTAIATRTAFDRVTEILEIDATLPFRKKLDALIDRQLIGAEDRAVLEALVDAGGAAAHRAWVPRPAELDTMISILEAFLQRTLILNVSAKQLAQKTPKRRKRGE